MFDSCILPAITYGAQNLVTTKKNMNILRVTQQAIERSMLGISLSLRKTNSWIKQKTRLVDVVEKGAKLKLTFAGRVVRGNANNGINQLYPEE